ncbi:MAG: TraB/GumN family protein [Kofleriaceae bacterium]
MIRRASIFVIAVVIACASRPPCPVSPTPAAARGPAFVWRAQRGDQRIWLYGTIHSAGIDAVPSVALEALDRSARLVTELGDQSPDGDKLRELAHITSGPGIDHLLPSNDWYDLHDALTGTVTEADLRRARPWYAMSLLSTHLAPTPGPAMDVLLTKRAQQRAMPIEPLETWEDQLTALDRAVTIDDLREAINARHAMHCDLARMRTAYVNGDVATMEALLLVPRTVELMLTPRNRTWLPKIEAYGANGGAFVAVGLGHLLGEDGLVAMLRRAGYTVERMQRR